MVASNLARSAGVMPYFQASYPHPVGVPFSRLGSLQCHVLQKWTEAKKSARRYTRVPPLVALQRPSHKP